MKRLTRMLLAATLLAATAADATAQTDTTVVVPATGYLPVKPSRPFSGPQTLLIVNTNATNNAKTTDITYYKYRADTVVAMASCYILVGQPGTYTLTFAEQATLRGSSNSGWADTAGKHTDSRKNRLVYKFVADGERTGFQRDESYAAENYQSCDFGEDEHFYISTTTAIADKIAAASGKTDHEDLDFIVWHGPTPADAAAAISRTTAGDARRQAPFDLGGRRRATPARRGISVGEGRKYISK